MNLPAAVMLDGRDISAPAVAAAPAAGQAFALDATGKIQPSLLSQPDLVYTEFVAGVNVVSTTESSGTTIVTADKFKSDGTAVWVEFHAPSVTTPSNAAGAFTILSLFEGSTQIVRLAALLTPAAAQAGQPVLVRRKIAPTIDFHTYTVTAHVSSTTGTPAVNAGSGGTATYAPGYVRVLRA